MSKLTGHLDILGENVKIGNRAFIGTNFESVTIHGDNTEIGAGAFGTNLKSLDIRGKNVKIRKNAFNDRTKLETITISGSVTEIGESAFSKCENLTASDDFSVGGTKIGDEAFWECTGLTSITIPSSMTRIGESAFKNCTSLTEIKFEGTRDEWNFVQRSQVFYDSFEGVNATTVRCSDGTSRL